MSADLQRIPDANHCQAHNLAHKTAKVSAEQPVLTFPSSDATRANNLNVILAPPKSAEHIRWAGGWAASPP